MEQAVFPTVSSGALVTLVLEGLKMFYRKFIVKNQEYNFPAWFYTLAIPVLNLLAQPLVGLLVGDNSLIPTDWITFGRLLVMTLLASLVSLVTYTNGLKPLIDYKRSQKLALDKTE